MRETSTHNRTDTPPIDPWAHLDEEPFDELEEDRGRMVFAAVMLVASGAVVFFALGYSLARYL